MDRSIVVYYMLSDLVDVEPKVIIAAQRDQTLCHYIDYAYDCYMTGRLHWCTEGYIHKAVISSLLDVQYIRRGGYFHCFNHLLSVSLLIQ